jgi:DNA-binding transcriptional LysR family regulator
VDLRQLEHFVAVAELRHFTRAAETLSISQSGLSASIRALERELGAVLFIRSTRRVELTDAGRALLGPSRQTLAGAAAARDAVAAVQGLLHGTLRIGAEQCVAGVDVPRLVSSFRASYPGVEVVLKQAGSAWLLDELAAGRLDVAFVATSPRPVDGLSLLPLAREPMVLVCHASHRLAGTDRLSLGELAGETFVDFQAEWGARAITERAFAAAGVSRDVALEVNDVETLLDLVAHGLGLALVPAPLVHGVSVVTLEPGSVELWQVAAATPAVRSRAAGALLERLPTFRAGERVPHSTRVPVRQA